MRFILALVLLLGINAEAGPLFILFGINNRANASAPQCSSLFFSTQSFGLTEASQNFLRNLPREYPKQMDWSSFQKLEMFGEQVKAFALALEQMSPGRRQFEINNLKKAIGEDANAPALLADLSTTLSKNYQPSQFELNRSFRYKLHKILKLLPSDLRPAMARVSLDPRRHKLNQQARDFMRGTEKKFDAIFSQTGFESYEKFVEALRKADDPLIKKALEILDNDQIEVVIRRPTNARFWLPKTGFQNQYVTGSSKGYFGNNRKTAEAILTGRTENEIEALDSELLPKYGTLAISAESNVKWSGDGTSHYGSDIYVLKKSGLADRLSIFPGDSLNPLASIAISRGWETWRSGVAFPEPLLEAQFIPWSRRLLMVPYMVEQLAQNSFGRPSDQPQGIKMNDRSGYPHTYWESQIFGRLNLDMVEAFQFSDSPPEGEFLGELKKRNIKIIDSRGGKSKPWVEGT